MKNAGRTLAPPGSEEEEAEMVRQALAQSDLTSAIADAGGKVGGSGGAGGKSGTEDRNRRQRQIELEEAMQLKSAMEANLLEMQLYAKQMELEQAELEKALAMSLQLEERRLEKLSRLSS